MVRVKPVLLKLFSSIVDVTRQHLDEWMYVWHQARRNFSPPSK
jgi:hypothetical protein